MKTKYLNFYESVINFIKLNCSTLHKNYKVLICDNLTFYHSEKKSCYKNCRSLQKWLNDLFTCDVNFFYVLCIVEFKSTGVKVWFLVAILFFKFIIKLFENAN